MSRRTMIFLLLVGAIPVGRTLALAAPNEQPPPASAAGPRPAAKSAALAGVVEVDETKLARISARVTGKSRIDKLYVNITGQKVKRGDPLADLYSPDLVALWQSLLDARRTGDRELQRTARDDLQQLERTARDRLQLWGVNKDQIEEVLKTGKPITHLTVRAPTSGHVVRKYQVEGSYVEEGTLLFDVVDLSTVWIEAAVKDEAVVPFLKRELPVRVTAKAVPKREFSGEVSGLFQDAGTRRLKVRFVIKNPRQELLPGMLATVLLDVPADASETKDAKVKELLKERLAILHELVKVATAEYHSGRVSFDRVQQATRALLDAELEQCESDKERMKVLEKIVALAKESEKNAVERYKTGVAAQSDALLAAAGRLEAEIALERLKSKTSAKPR